MTYGLGGFGFGALSYGKLRHRARDPECPGVEGPERFFAPSTNSPCRACRDRAGKCARRHALPAPADSADDGPPPTRLSGSARAPLPGKPRGPRTQGASARKSAPQGLDPAAAQSARTRDSLAWRKLSCSSRRAHSRLASGSVASPLLSRPPRTPPPRPRSGRASATSHKP